MKICLLLLYYYRSRDVLEYLRTERQAQQDPNAGNSHVRRHIEYQSQLMPNMNSSVRGNRRRDDWIYPNSPFEPTDFRTRFVPSDVIGLAPGSGLGGLGGCS